MTDVSATEAARNFADLLDAVERGEQFTIVRRGRAVAHLEPIGRNQGAAVKRMLGHHSIDKEWTRDLRVIRQAVRLEERP